MRATSEQIGTMRGKRVWWCCTVCGRWTSKCLPYSHCSAQSFPSKLHWTLRSTTPPVLRTLSSTMSGRRVFDGVFLLLRWANLIYDGENRWVAKPDRKVKWDWVDSLSREWKSTVNGAFSKLDFLLNYSPSSRACSRMLISMTACSFGCWWKEEKRKICGGWVERWRWWYGTSSHANKREFF